MTRKKALPEIPELKTGRREKNGGVFCLSLKSILNLAAAHPAALAGLLGAMGLSLSALSLGSRACRGEYPEPGVRAAAIEPERIFRKRAFVDDRSLAFARASEDSGFILRDSLNAKTGAAQGAVAGEAVTGKGIEKAALQGGLSGLAASSEDAPAFDMPTVEELQAQMVEKAKASFGGPSRFGGMNRPGFTSRFNKLAAGSSFGAGFGRDLGGRGAALSGFAERELAPRALEGAQRQNGPTTRFKQSPQQIHNVAARQANRGQSSKAMGQLKLANALSYDASRAPSDNKAAQLGADAFEQQKSKGGADGFYSVRSEGDDDVVMPLDGGAPDLTDNKSDKFGENGLPTPPEFTGENMTPYDGEMNQAKKEGKKSRSLMILGLVLSATGTALMATASILLAAGVTTGLAIALMAIGALLMIAGMLTSMLGNKTKDGAKKRGQNIGNQAGQQQQGQRVEDYVDATYEGKDYKPEQFHMPKSTVGQDVRSQQDATYEVR